MENKNIILTLQPHNVPTEITNTSSL